MWVIGSFVMKPQGQQIIRTIDALTPGDIAQYFQQAKPQVSRLEALQQADALMTYFETVKSTEGQKAVQDLVQAVKVSKVSQ
jgi:hypothetical protein